MRKPSLVTPTQLIPLLDQVANPSFMLQLLQRELSALTNVPIRVTQCQASAEKNREALELGRCFVTFNVTVEVEGGRQWQRRLLGILPVERDFFGAELLERCREAIGHPEVVPFQRLQTYIPELRMAVLFFPLDTALAALVELTGATNDQLMASYLPECRKGATIHHTAWELKHYKPSQRCVIRLTADLFDQQAAKFERVIYAKLFPDDRGAAIYQDAQRLWQLACRSKNLRVPEPLGYDPERRMLVMAEASGGRDLSQWIDCIEERRPLPEGVDFARVERCMAILAGALAELHGSELRPGDRRTFHSELADCRTALELLSRNGQLSELAREAGGLLDRLGAYAPDEESLVPSHGSFHIKQTIGNDQRLTILDWDSLILASPALDAANFLNRLLDQPLRNPGKAKHMERLAEVFRREFLSLEPEVSEQQLELYGTLKLIDKAIGAFRRPGRVKKTEREVRHLLTVAQQFVEHIELA